MVDPNRAVTVAEMAQIEAIEPNINPRWWSSEIETKKASMAEYPTAYKIAISVLNTWKEKKLTDKVSKVALAKVNNKKQ